MPSQFFIVHVNSVNRDDRKINWHASFLEEVKQGRNEFPPGQIAGCAKNDEQSRFNVVIRVHDSHPLSHSV
jgi:hypothetical protein